MKEMPFDPYDFFGYIASGLVLVALAQLTFGFPKVFGAELKPFDMAVTVLGVYIAGQIIAGPAKFFFEDLLVHKVLGSPTKNLLRPVPHRLRNLIFPGFYKPLPFVNRAKIATKIDALQLDCTDAEGIFLTIRYSPEILHNERLISKLDLFLNKYGFSRNVSFSLMLASVCLAIVGYLEGNTSFFRFSIAALITGTLLFYRYLNFFRQYSYELFNSYACMSEKGDS